MFAGRSSTARAGRRSEKSESLFIIFHVLVLVLAATTSRQILQPVKTYSNNVFRQETSLDPTQNYNILNQVTPGQQSLFSPWFAVFLAAGVTASGYGGHAGSSS